MLQLLAQHLLRPIHQPPQPLPPVSRELPPARSAQRGPPDDDTSVGATEYMIDVSGVVTNNSNAPLVVSSVSYTVEYTSGGSESGTVSINETLPPGRSDSWDTGSFNYPVAESSVAVTDVSYSSASSEVGCSGRLNPLSCQRGTIARTSFRNLL